MSNIEISEVSSRRERNAFIKFPWRVYANDPAWVPPRQAPAGWIFHDAGRGLSHPLVRLVLAEGRAGGGFRLVSRDSEAARAGLPYVYLGYWVEGSPRMAYKTSFHPLERLGRDGWRRLDEVEIEVALNEPLALPTRRIRHRLLIDA